MLLFIFKCILICSLTGSVLIAAMMLSRPLTERFFSSSWHYIVGLCIMIIMIFPARIALPKNAAEAGHVSVTAEEETGEKGNFNSSTVHSENVEKQNESPFDIQSLLTFFSYAWAITASLLFLRKKIGYAIFFRKMMHQTEAVTDIGSVKAEGFCIRRGKCVSSPMVAGVISPVLFLPDIPLSDKEMGMIISHERVHLRRRDIVAKRLVAFVKCIHFFNPLVYILAKKIDLDCEISCDLAATKMMNCEEQKSYMLTILNLIAYGKAESPVFTAGILSGKETLKRRFFKIKNREKVSKKTKLISAFIALTLILSCVLVSGVFAAELKKPEIDAESICALFNNTEQSEAMTDEVTLAMGTTEVNSSHETSFEGSEANDKNVSMPKPEPTTDDFAANSSLQGVEQCDPSLQKENGDSIHELMYPCDEKTVFSHFGDRGRHNGIDFASKRGSNVYACADGKVIQAEYDNENGNTVKLMISDDTVLAFSHLDSMSVNVGDKVSKGQVIAKSGNTGASTGPHLHFSVIKDGKYVDPEKYLG